MSNRRKSGALVIFLLITCLISLGILKIGLNSKNELPTFSIFDRLNLSGNYEQELKPGEVITIFDEKTGAEIDKENRVVYPGDELISEDNINYKVTRVKGNKAFAKSYGKATDMVWKDEWDTLPVAKPLGGNNLIAIYHTHSDESYVPTDGTESIPAKGGIFKVGKALGKELEGLGLKVIDDTTPHEPHDANAYHRSRKTAFALLKQKPLALMDVHRDGVPDPEFYNQKMQGEAITKIRLVVGRQNPKMSTNLGFAKRIKAYMDKHKPGLIKGIFMGRGNYNQDLATNAILIEVGTHTNTRGRAERGATIFASALPAVLNVQSSLGGAGGVGGAGGTTSDQGTSKGAWKNVGWLGAAVLIGGGIFLFVSTGSLKGMKSKLGELGKTEFANFFGLKRGVNRRKKK